VGAACLGVASALDHRAWLAVPFLIAAPAALPLRPAVSGLAAGLAAGYAVLTIPGLLLAPGGMLQALLPSSLRPSPGLASVFLCWDVPPEPAAVLLTISAWIAAGLAFAIAFRARPPATPALVLAAAGYLVAVFLSVGAEADDLALPLALLTLGVIQRHG
jgi:uncharacterized membrane protein YjjB (DUF3815 family)